MMEKPSELDNFLRGRTEQGEVVTREASFTVAREKALQKIAEFQLPFSEAWAVKLIQAAVADGSQEPIKVELRAKEARFHLPLRSINLDDFEAAFYSPDPHPSKPLRHLLTGLWAVGLHRNWPFQLVLAKERTSLVWDGKTLQRLRSDQEATRSYIHIDHQFGKNESAGLAHKTGRAAMNNAELLLTLSKWCFTCPVPLTVDGRRLDSLQHCPTHGWTPKVFPLALGFGTEDLQPLSIPPGTFENLPSPHETLISKFNSGDPELRTAGLASLLSHEPRAHAQVSFLVAYFLESVQRGNNTTEVPRATESLVYWVQDGVVVDSEALTKRKTYTALACFLCAEGLSTDLSRFHLLKSKERRRRIRLARRSIAEELSSMTNHSKHLRYVARKGQTDAYLVGGVLALTGTGVMWFNPLLGSGILALAALTAKTGGKNEKSRVDAIIAGIEDLRAHLSGLDS